MACQDEGRLIRLQGLLDAASKDISGRAECWLACDRSLRETKERSSMKTSADCC